MQTQETNPANETKTIELTYMEARRLRELIARESREDAERAAFYLNHGEVSWAETEAKKHKQAKAILSKIESIL